MTARLRPGNPWRAAIWAAALAIAALAQAAGEDETFMPKGGRALLIESMGPGASLAQWRELVSATRTEAQWEQFAATRKPAATEREKATLAAYLAVNMPLPAAALKAAKAADAIAAVLPRDGRQLAWDQCQFCHSLFTSHLMQGRSAQGWRTMFMSPFHRELKMTPQEREEFARYSAINMPMKVDDVPPELRF